MGLPDPVATARGSDTGHGKSYPGSPERLYLIKVHSLQQALKTGFRSKDVQPGIDPEVD